VGGKPELSRRMLARMENRWTATDLEGVFRRSLPTHADERGSFRELWRSSLTAGLTDERFVQANLSRSAAGVLRGLHFHLRQADLWIVLAGGVHVALVDLRPSLAGAAKERPSTLEAQLAEGECLFIPAGVAHGFWALADTALLYLVSNEYDGSDEHGFAWNDPALDLRWPAARRPILSGRDASAPSMARAVAAAREASGAG
jgi:dTDP-4-dehydrorhamnose 3,5-epimerase